MSFRVTKIIDGDTFEVTPVWKWDNQSGNVIRPKGYDTPEEGQFGHQAAKDKLATLILGKDVDLKNAVKITYGRLLCDVFYNDTNIADHFPQYQS